MKTLDPDYRAPTRFSKMTEGWDDFSCACVCVEFHFQVLGSSLTLFVLALVLGFVPSQALAVFEEMSPRKFLLLGTRKCHFPRFLGIRFI